MFAVIKTGGKQYKVRAGDKIRVEKLAADVGEKVQFDSVMMLGGEPPVIGAPRVEGAAVQAEVVEQFRDSKVIHFVKRRRKHGSKRTKGHRQHLTLLRVTDILATGADSTGVKQAVGAAIAAKGSAGPTPEARQAADGKGANAAKGAEDAEASKGAKESSDAKATKGDKEAKGAKDSQDAKSEKEAKSAKATKDAKDAKGDQEAKTAKATKATKDDKGAKSAKESKETKDAKATKAMKATKDDKGAKGAKESKDAKATKDAKKSKDSKESKGAKKS